MTLLKAARHHGMEWLQPLSLERGGGGSFQIKIKLPLHSVLLFYSCSFMNDSFVLDEVNDIIPFNGSLWLDDGYNGYGSTVYE